jgi:hypothetical protein
VASKKQQGINPDLEKAISDMLKEVMSSTHVDMEVKLKVIDRAINLEKIKQKVQDDSYGTGFFSGDGE